jgi:hypothetical protein
MASHYELKITSNLFKEKIQIWSWYGQRKGENKVLRNVTNYATDCELLLNNKNEIVGGYSFLYDDTKISVKELAHKESGLRNENN